MRELRLSASAISTYKACPFRFRNAYVLGIRADEDTESQRVGTNWHEILEVASLEPGSPCPECKEDNFIETHDGCPICNGSGYVPNDVMDAVVRALDKAYADVPLLDKETKDLERTRLLYSLIGYRWYYGTDYGPAITREQYFKLPLLNPDTGHPVPNVTLEGKIDKLIAINKVHNIVTRVGIKEHKSTSKSIDNDSTYWGHLNLDTQTGLYIYAARRLQLEGKLAEFDIFPTDPLISEVSYDVYHKPKITPKKLTQADSKKFVETGEYCGQEFVIETTYMEGEGTRLIACAVNGIVAETEDGKKEGTFAIRETMEMYGARLLLDITQRPEFYFNRKPFIRTDAEIKDLELELYDIAKDMMSKIRADRWYHNEQQCEATFRCSYIDSCYNHIELDPENPPSGMRCIFKGKDN